MSSIDNEDNQQQDLGQEDANDVNNAAENESQQGGNVKRRGKLIGSLKDNIKGALKGNAKDIFVLKVKAVVYPAILIIIIIILFIEGEIQEDSKVVVNTIGSIYAGQDSTSESATMFNEKNSLVLATQEDITKIKDTYFENIKRRNESLYNELSKEYFGKTSETVANRINNITVDFKNDSTLELDKVEKKPQTLDGAAKLTDNATLIEHILQAEKYNFNNIIWRSYERSADGIKESDVELQLDDSTKLLFPKNDPNDSEDSKHTVSFFASKINPYLQSWMIPLGMFMGTIDSQQGEILNGRFAYELLASGYHEIVADRYKIERLTRETTYRIYDQTTITKTVECEDINENGHWRCFDSDSKSEESIKENIKENVSITENNTYKWDYVLSYAKMFDNVMSATYKLEPYYSYSTDNYNKFIKDKSISAEDFRKAERQNSQADNYQKLEKEYEDTVTNTVETDVSEFRKIKTVTTVIKKR